MSRRFLLERHYIDPVYDRMLPSRIREVGYLLSAAFEGPPPDPNLDKLVERLPTRH